MSTLYIYPDNTQWGSIGNMTRYIDFSPMGGICAQTSSDEDSGSLWYVGVIMSIVASILSNFGLNVQKLSMNREAVIEFDRQRPYIRQPLWALGLSMIIFGAIGDFAALGFAAQSLITPVGGVTMVANVVFASFFLGETLTRKDIMATMVIVSGVALITVFASKKEACYTADDLIVLFQRWQFIVYTLVFTGSFFAFWYITRRASRKRRIYGDLSPQYLATKNLHRFGYPCLSGLIGAQDVLFAKATAELIKSSIKGENQLIYLSTWFIIVMMVACIFGQIHFLAMALKHFDAVYVVPVFQCFFISGSIIAGAVYYREFEEFTAAQGIGFLVALALTLIGVFLLSQRAIKTSPQSQTPAAKLKPLTRFRAAVNCVMFLNWRYKYPEWRAQRLKALEESSIAAPIAGTKTRTISSQTLITGFLDFASRHWLPSSRGADAGFQQIAEAMPGSALGMAMGIRRGRMMMVGGSQPGIGGRSASMPASTLGRSLVGVDVGDGGQGGHGEVEGEGKRGSAAASAPGSGLGKTVSPPRHVPMQGPKGRNGTPPVSSRSGGSTSRSTGSGTAGYRPYGMLHGYGPYGPGGDDAGVWDPRLELGQRMLPGFFMSGGHSHHPEVGMPQYGYGGMLSGGLSFEQQQMYDPHYLRRKEEEMRRFNRNVHNSDMLAPVPSSLGLAAGLSEVGGYLRRRFWSEHDDERSPRIPGGSPRDRTPRTGRSTSSAGGDEEREGLIVKGSNSNGGRKGGDGDGVGVGKNMGDVGGQTVVTVKNPVKNYELMAGRTNSTGEGGSSSPSTPPRARAVSSVLTQGPQFRSPGDTVLTPSNWRDGNIDPASPGANLGGRKKEKKKKKPLGGGLLQRCKAEMEESSGSTGTRNESKYQSAVTVTGTPRKSSFKNSGRGGSKKTNSEKRSAGLAREGDGAQGAQGADDPFALGSTLPLTVAKNVKGCKSSEKMKKGGQEEKEKDDPDDI